MESFDLAGAGRAAEAGELLTWLYTLLRREPGANRSLAAILKGQQPLLDGPVLLSLEDLPQGAGPGPEFQWPKDSQKWESEIAPLMDLAQERLPPLLVRHTGGKVHLPDGSHRLDAWRRRGETHGWAIVWRDRDPMFDGWWGPFAPTETPTIRLIEADQARRFLPPVEEDGMVLAALVDERIVAAVRLVPEFGSLTLRTLKVAEECRGRRLGARLLHHLLPHMEGQKVYCLAYPWLDRFYGEFGFVSVEPQRLPEGLRRRYEAFQDEKGCLALVRGL
jgi:N-acetylglutamate synthase-like GNAT family acetyltransferase